MCLSGVQSCLLYLENSHRNFLLSPMTIESLNYVKGYNDMNLNPRVKSDFGAFYQKAETLVKENDLLY